MPHSTVRTTCPRDCYDACGIEVEMRHGAIAKVRGDRQHPMSRGQLCPKCAMAYNGAWRDATMRLQSPMRRSGRKGLGQFEPISWDTALDEIAARLRAVVERHGAEQVFHTHYTGTCSLLAGLFPLRFFNRLGAVEVDPDTVCNKAGHAALQLVFGESFRGFDPRGAADASCILVWGANPSASAPHVHKHWLAEAPGMVIVVDPLRHPTAAAADLHLQPRPGSDAALAFAMLHVIAAAGRVDHAFLEQNVIGWRLITAQLPDCTPAWGETQTGVPAAAIEAAALAYSAGPSMLWLGQGLQRQTFGGNIMRACSLLPIFTGNIGRPGTGFLYLNGIDTRGIEFDYLTASQLRSTPANSISHMDLADCLADSARSHALFTWNNNIAASSPQQRRLQSALQRDDLLHVAIDLFHTDTVAYADYVLPAASFLEFDDLVIPYFNYAVSAQAKVAEPMGDSLPNQEIFRRLAARMGYDEAPLHEPDRDVLDTLIRQTGIAESFDTLKQKGTVPYGDAAVIPFASLQFKTPSGKIEVASPAFEQAGMSLAPMPQVEPLPRDGRLRVLSPASTWLMNSSYGNDRMIREKLGEPKVMLNPGDAAARNLQAGSSVRLRNETGSLPLVVGLDEGVPPGVCVVHKGRWPGTEASGVNINAINDGSRSDVAESCAVHSITAWLEPDASSPSPR